MKWAFYFYVLSSYTVVIPLVRGLYLRKALSKDLRLFLTYLVVTLLFITVIVILSSRGINDLWIENCYLPIELGLVLWVLSLWQETALGAKLIRYTILGFVVVWLLELSTGKLFHDYSEFARPLESVLFVVAAALTIYEKHFDSEVLLTDQPSFWICSGILVYYTPTLLVYVFSRVLAGEAREVLISATLASTLFTIASNILYAKAYSCPSQPTKYGGHLGSPQVS